MHGRVCALDRKSGAGSPPPPPLLPPPPPLLLPPPPPSALPFALAPGLPTTLMDDPWATLAMRNFVTDDVSGCMYPAGEVKWQDKLPKMGMSTLVPPPPHIHTHRHIHTHIHIHIHTHIHTYAYLPTHTHAHTHTYT